MSYTQIFEFFSWKFPFHLTFTLEFPEFSVEWLVFRKSNNFRIFWNFSQKISVLFVSVSKMSKLFGRMVSAPGVLKISGSTSVLEKLRFRDGLVWTVGLTVEMNSAFLNFYGEVARLRRLLISLLPQNY